MKAIQTAIGAATIATAMLVALPAEAGKRDHRFHGDDQRYVERVSSYDRVDNRRYARKAHKRKLRLDLPVRVHGDSYVPLKRLVRQYHGIDPRDYRLVKVVVDSHPAYRRSAARVFVGDDRSALARLGHGRSHIAAPRGRYDERWVLKLDNARVSNVRVVLEPRKRAHRWARVDHRDYRDRTWRERNWERKRRYW